MSSIYINICELFLQKLIQGFRQNNIGIFILTFRYTMHQNEVSTKVLLMPVNDFIFYSS